MRNRRALSIADKLLFPPQSGSVNPRLIYKADRHEQSRLDAKTSNGISER